MRILFTGGSSFSGTWFIKELAKAGHEVVSVFQRGKEEYEGVRACRMSLLEPLCRQVFHCSFGDEKFLKMIKESRDIDIYCHHAADVANYKSEEFDLLGAVSRNTKNAESVIIHLKDKGCRQIIVTGTTAEPDEGEGSDYRRAYSLYGLSKRFTFEIFRYCCQKHQMPLGKFVITNVFGPLEEPRFTAYLMDCWLKNRVAVVKTPAYIRDNIPVSLLAKAYLFFAIRPIMGTARLVPSLWREPQGEFAERCAREVRTRLPLECRLNFARQDLFLEPLIRIGVDSLDLRMLGWDEKAFWDEFVEFYRGKSA